jgi:hypothetical protein
MSNGNIRAGIFIAQFSMLYVGSKPVGLTCVQVCLLLCELHVKEKISR